MTDPLTIAIAAAIFGGSAFVEVIRANRRMPFFPPSACERDAQDGRGEGGEGLGLETHTGLNLTTREQDIA